MTVPVYVNGRFVTQRTSGVQRYATCVVTTLDSIARDWGESGLSFTLLCPPGTGAPPTLPAIPTRRVGTLHGHAWEQLELSRFAADGVLVSLCNSGPLRHRQQVVTIHDASVFAVPEAYSWLFRTYHQFLQARLGRTAAAVVTDSHFSAAELTQRAGVPPDKVTVVWLGSEHLLSVAADPVVLKRLPDARPVVLTVGSRSHHKNLSAVAEAARLLGPACHVVAVGGTNERVFGATRDAGGSGLTTLGYVSDGELRALYERAACLVYPSLYEGFGLPPLEAMASGCPVVTSRAASLPEVCGDGALYCDATDPRDIAAAIRRVLDEPGLREDLRRRGLARARELTWDRAVRALLAVVRRVASRGSR